MSQDQKYNGYTNYATWRVNLEIFDGIEQDSPCFDDPAYCREYAEEFIYETSSDGLARDYALAFLSEVNWYEISEHFKESEEV